MSVSSRKRLLIVGHGMAATRLVREIAERSPGQFAITVVGDEMVGGYNRVLLSSLLAGETDESALVMQDPAWYEKHDIHIVAGDAIVNVDVEQRYAETERGARFDWDYLVLATGSRAARLPIPGSNLDGVLTLRTLQEARRLVARVKQADDSGASSKAVVVGGGLLGLEAACAIRSRGAQVTVVHNEAWPMNRQLDGEAGDLLRQTLAGRGIDFIPEAACVRFLTDDSGHAVTALQLADGRCLPCATAIMALGIIPEVSLGRQMGLAIERAIVVDRWLQTSHERVFALGECCQIDRELFGLVAPVYQQAKILSGVLHHKAVADSQQSGNDAGPEVTANLLPCYQSQPSPTRLKVSGVDVFSTGIMSSEEGADPLRSMAMRDGRTGHYRRLWWKGRRLVGAVMFGDISDSNHYLRLIEEACETDASPATLLAPSTRIAV